MQVCYLNNYQIEYVTQINKDEVKEQKIMSAVEQWSAGSPNESDLKDYVVHNKKAFRYGHALLLIEFLIRLTCCSKEEVLLLETSVGSEFPIVWQPTKKRQFCFKLTGIYLFSPCRLSSHIIN